MERHKTNRLSVLLLAAGLGCAGAIYFLTPESVADPLLNDPRAERKYRRELAMYGGKANVVSAEIIDWFDSLWQGRALAGTVVGLTVAGTLVFRFFALLPPVAPDPEAPGGDSDLKPPV